MSLHDTNKEKAIAVLQGLENGKIAEHWDVMETILPEDQRKNANGKF